MNFKIMGISYTWKKIIIEFGFALLADVFKVLAFLLINRYL
jgi:hypothetical protein